MKPDYLYEILPQEDGSYSMKVWSKFHKRVKKSPNGNYELPLPDSCFTVTGKNEEECHKNAEAKFGKGIAINPFPNRNP